jgi:hypothetical protein
MREIGRNSTSGITLDVIIEINDPHFLKGGVTSAKLRRLASVLADFHVFGPF